MPDETVVVADPHFPNLTGEGETVAEAVEDLADKVEALLTAVHESIERLNEVKYE